MNVEIEKQQLTFKRLNPTNTFRILRNINIDILVKAIKCIFGVSEHIVDSDILEPETIFIRGNISIRNTFPEFLGYFLNFI